MLNLRPRTLILIGFIGVVLGFVLPFLMVIKAITSSIFLNFFAYGASVAGMMMGLMGAAGWYHERRPHSDHHE